MYDTSRLAGCPPCRLNRAFESPRSAADRRPLTYCSLASNVLQHFHRATAADVLIMVTCSLKTGKCYGLMGNMMMMRQMSLLRQLLPSRSAVPLPMYSFAHTSPIHSHIMLQCNSAPSCHNRVTLQPQINRTVGNIAGRQGGCFARTQT
jgi:hypothetical protein